MVYDRGTRADYDGWRQLGNEGWSYDEVLPYFKKLEHYQRGADAFHGSGGPVRISRPRHLAPRSPPPFWNPPKRRACLITRT